MIAYWSDSVGASQYGRRILVPALICAKPVISCDFYGLTSFTYILLAATVDISQVRDVKFEGALKLLLGESDQIA